MPYHMQASLTMKAAKLRKRFYQDWLPASPMHARAGGMRKFIIIVSAIFANQ